MIGLRCCVTAWLSLVILLTGCSSATLTDSWKDPDYRGTIRKVYVVGVTNVDIDRYQFEDVVSQELQAHGVKAIPSYSDLDFPVELDDQAITARASALGADSILMARVLGKYSRHYEADYRHTATEYQVTVLEATLYDVGSGQQLWSAKLETIIDRRIEFLLSDFAKAVVQDLRKQNLL